MYILRHALILRALGTPYPNSIRDAASRCSTARRTQAMACPHGGCKTVIWIGKELLADKTRTESILLKMFNRSLADLPPEWEAVKIAGHEMPGNRHSQLRQVSK